MSQSLIHQVSVSDDKLMAEAFNFSENLSQSLIHQVSVSDTEACDIHYKQIHSLNPLFIRSQFQICNDNHNGNHD